MKQESQCKVIGSSLMKLELDTDNLEKNKERIKEEANFLKLKCPGIFPYIQEKVEEQKPGTWEKIKGWINKEG